MSRYVSSPTKAGMYKDFPFEGNSLTSLSLGIETLNKVFSIVKLVNGDVTHYLVKSSKDMNLLVSSVTSFFFSRVIKGFCSTAEPLFFTKSRLFLVAGRLVSVTEVLILILSISSISSFKRVVITFKGVLMT